MVKLLALKPVLVLLGLYIYKTEGLIAFIISFSIRMKELLIKGAHIVGRVGKAECER